MKGAQLLRTMHRLCSVWCACPAEAAEGRPGHLRVDCSPRMDRQVRHSNAPSRYYYHHNISQSLQSGSRRDLLSARFYVCMHACVCARVCACVFACACVLVAAASTEPTDLRFRRRFTLSEFIRYKLSRIQLPDYKGTCHTTNVSRSDSSSVFCGFAP
jgi:hypothetical protein